METNLVVPNWFIRFVSGVLGLGVPWAAWITYSQIAADVRAETQIVLVADIKEEIKGIRNISVRLNEHLANPDIHESELRRIRDALDRTDRWLERLEKRVERNEKPNGH